MTNVVAPKRDNSTNNGAIAPRARWRDAFSPHATLAALPTAQLLPFARGAPGRETPRSSPGQAAWDFVE